jgi:hypothetical protein
MALNPYASAPWQTAPFTDEETASIRYYAGYTATTEAFGYTFDGTALPTLDYICSQMLPANQTTLRATLATLATLEAAIDNAGVNLDTDSASVWFHNKNEVDDRIALFNNKRRRMCASLGVIPGPGLMGGSSLVRS